LVIQTEQPFALHTKRRSFSF